MLDNKETIPYKRIELYINMKVEDYVKCNIDKNELPLNMPEFYKEVLSSWFSLKSEPKTAKKKRCEVMWNNRFIKIANHTIYNKKLYENGMIYIDDILDDNGFFCHLKHLQTHLETISQHTTTHALKMLFQRGGEL